MWYLALIDNSGGDTRLVLAVFWRAVLSCALWVSYMCYRGRMALAEDLQREVKHSFFAELAQRALDVKKQLKLADTRSARCAKRRQTCIAGVVT